MNESDEPTTALTALNLVDPKSSAQDNDHDDDDDEDEMTTGDDQPTAGSSHQKQLARKIRFMKRLKNCIETKRGNKFNYLQQLSYIGRTDWLKKSENVLYESSSSFYGRGRDMFKSSLPLIKRSVASLNYDTDSNVSMSDSRIELDTSVNPVYF